jgi:prepilin-type processing-associated H-X9-DG protein
MGRSSPARLALRNDAVYVEQVAVFVASERRLGSCGNVNITHGFGSCHPGGFHMVFCDGSVRKISYGISETVNNNLANRRDNQAVDPGDFSF